MDPLKNRTISVPDMRRMLGLKKTESYWLVHKNYFETVLVAGKMRIITESFMKWYDNQDHYCIINGPKPGKELRKTYYSSKDIGEILGIKPDLVASMVHYNNLDFYIDKHTMRISKKSFDEWVKTQEHYRLKKDRISDEKLRKVSISIPEMARILGLEWKETYELVHNSKKNKYLEVVKVAGKKRILSDSFRKWYVNQDEYHFDDDEEYFGVRLNKAARDGLFSIKEASTITGVPTDKIYRMIYAGKLMSTTVDGEKKIRISEISAIPEKESKNGVDRRKK